MLNFLKQLFIERLLSGAKPYVAFHPELGVPIGIFNYKDEPNRQSRINSIKKMGKYGNPTSLKFAKLLGIDNPIPSFVDQATQDAIDKAVKEAYEKGVKDGSKTSYQGGSYGAGTLGLFEEAQKQRVAREGMSVGEVNKLGELLKGGALNTAKIQENMGFILDMLALEDTLRIGISQSLGMTNEQLFDTIDELNEAGKSSYQWGLTVDKLFETFKAISMEIGRNLRIPPEVTTRVALLTKTLEGFDGAAFAEAFDRIGFSLESAIGGVDDTNNAMSDVLKTGRAMGVVMETFLKNVSGEIKLINTYQFENGVQGLSRMVARAQRLGVEMGDVTSLAEGLLDPEGAIEFAAQMQVIGGAASDLTDPFKLMYMASNDLEGLQTAIIDTAAAAATFDETKNKFIIEPATQRQLRDQAKAMGMNYQDLADAATKAARESAVLSQMEFTEGISPEDKELIASMAQIGKGGVAEVKIPGVDELVNVADVTDEQLELLRKEGMSDTDIYKQQLTVAEKANQYLALIDTGVRIMVDKMGGDMRDALQEAFSQTAAGKMNLLSDDQIQTMMGGDTKEIAKLIGELGGTLSKEALNLVKDASISLGATQSQDWENVLPPANDFILRPGMSEPLRFNKGDLIIGGTELDAILQGGMGGNTELLNEVSNMTTNMSQTINSGVKEHKITGELTIRDSQGGSGTVSAEDVVRAFNRNSAASKDFYMMLQS